MRKIIFLEGICGAGKSTIMKRIAQRVKAITVPEISEYSRSVLLPFTTSDNIEHNFQTNTKIEILRELFISGKTEFPIIFDRSYLSTIVLSAAFGDYLPESYTFRIANQCIDQMKSGTLAVPDAVLWLSCPIETCNKRNNMKTKNIPTIWTEEKRLLKQIYIYELLSKFNIIRIINADNPIENVTAQCLEIINSPNMHSTSYFIEQFELFTEVLRNEHI